MANLSLIYDGLITLIEAQLSSYHRLADAIDIASNDILRLEKGYSLAISGGENTDRFIQDSSLSTSRSFTMTLVNLYVASELDPVARSLQEKNLLEDAYLVWKQLQTVTFLGGIQVANAKYESDEGIVYLDGDDKKGISITSVLSAEYFE